ncbi:MAG: HAD family hydrolase, partial [Acidobacteria bacterium]
MNNLRWPIVLFDLDGTLVNTVDVIVRSFQHCYLEVLGQELPAETARSWMGRTLLDTFAVHGPQLAEQLDKSFREFNIANLARLQTDYVGVKELIIQLYEAGIKMGVVTAKRKLPAGISVT